jgi:hypothetical protein
MGKPERNIMLKGKWKQEPPMNEDQHQAHSPWQPSKAILLVPMSQIMDYTLTKRMYETMVRKQDFRRNADKPRTTYKQSVSGTKNNIK